VAEIDPRGMRLRVGEELITCELLHDGAPRTCRAIADLLPLEGELHYAKIAGEEVFFGIPLLLPVEHGAHVPDLPAGSIVYWPVRQVFCLYYGQPQDEAATVTVFARVTENLEGLRRIGEQVRACQGERVRVEPLPSLAAERREQ
jgi:hypothetical protein